MTNLVAAACARQVYYYDYKITMFFFVKPLKTDYILILLLIFFVEYNNSLRFIFQNTNLFGTLSMIIHIKLKCSDDNNIIIMWTN